MAAEELSQKTKRTGAGLLEKLIGFAHLRSRLLVTVVAIALVVLLMAPRLFTPATTIFDERYFVNTIRALRAHGEYRYLEQYSTHPPHGTIAATLAVTVLGDSPFGWRAMPLLAHGALMALITVLGVVIFESFAVGLLAAMLFSLDGIAFGQATTLFFNAPMEVFLVSGLLCGIIARRTLSKRIRFFAVGASGLSQGIAAGFRWPALFLILVTGYLVASCYRKEQGCLSFLGLLGTFIAGIVGGYVVPFFLLGLWGAWDSFSFINFHVDTFRAVYNLKCDHRYNSPWWSWPLLLRPVWYHFVPPNAFQESPTIQGVVALGNPLLFALIPAAIVWHGRRWFRGENPTSQLLLVAALAMWLPWALVDANTYIHYIYPTLPFTLLLVSHWLVSMWDKRPLFSKSIAAMLLIGVTLLFGIFYPLYAALPVSEKYWRSLLWLSSWL